MTIHRLVRPTGPGIEQLRCADGTQTANKIRIEAPSNNAQPLYLGTSPVFTAESAWASVPPGYVEWIGDEVAGNVFPVGSVYVLITGANDTFRGGAFQR